MEIAQQLDIDGAEEKTHGKPIKMDLELNGYFEDMIYDKTQWHRLIHLVDPVQWKIQIVVVVVVYRRMTVHAMLC